MAEIDRLIVGFMVDEVVGGFFISVPPGHVACVYDRGYGVLKKIWGPGLHLKIPFWQVAKLFNAQTLEYGIRKGFNVRAEPEALGDEPITAATKDGKQLLVEGALLFRIDKDQVTELWENIGESFVSKIVRPVSRSRVRSVIAEFSADEVVTTRRSLVESRIKEELTKVMAEKGLIVEGMLLSDVRLA
ncbi:MAG: prohibitin family protein [Patescibacteria group bacterium]|nr:prohibitin family protein [Patescibacteria group bacterium]